MLLPLLVVLACSAPLRCVGEEPAPTADERIKKALERFPEADTQYGSHERNLLDFWKAKTEQPTPLVIFIHGGGFVGGSKSQIGESLLKDLLASGVSVAAVEYRFVTTDPFPAPMHDGARAVQFLRSKAAEWNIDPKRVACYGLSAGAGMSLWLAFHDDLAKPESEDPVARQSTRLTCAGSFNGQSSYDPKQIKEWIGVLDAKTHPSLLLFYGTKSEEELEQSAKRELAREASAISHLSAGDPPVLRMILECARCSGALDTATLAAPMAAQPVAPRRTNSTG